MLTNLPERGQAVGRTVATSPTPSVSAALLAAEEMRSDHLLSAFIVACRLIHAIRPLLTVGQDPAVAVAEVRRLFDQHADRVTGALDPAVAWPPAGTGVRS